MPQKPGKKRSQKRLEREPAEDARLYRELVMRAPIGLAVFQFDDIEDTRSLRIVSINSAAERALGIQADQNLGTRIVERFPAAFATRAPELLAQVVRTQAPLDLGEGKYGDGQIAEGVFSIKAFPLPENRVGMVLENVTERKEAEDALRKSERVLREAESLGHTGSWEQDLVSGEIFNTEENLRLFFGDDRTKGKPFEDYPEVVHPDDREFVLQRRTEMLAGGRPDIEYRVVRPDGSIHVIYGLATVVRDESGRAVRLHGTNVDVTERKKGEEALRTQKELLQKIFDHTPVIIRMIGADGQWRMINRAWEDTFGWTLEDVQQPSFNAFAEMYPDPREYRRVLDFIGARSGQWEEFKAKVRDGRTVDLSFTNVYLSDGTSLGFGLDITERKRAEQERERLFNELQESRTRLQMLSNRLLVAQEMERRAIARELHDEVGQALTAAKINLESISRRKGVDSDKPLADTIQVIDQVLNQVRSLSLDLRPSMLDDLGLVPAMRWYVDRQAQLGGFSARFSPAPMDVPIPPDVQTACYRITQGALTNVIKHANAKQVLVELRQLPSSGGTAALELVVRDDGRGFDTAAAFENEAQSASMGLLIMQERAQLLGGQLEIVASPTSGTVVRAIFPLKGDSP